ncbi:MAG: hypothetical protein WC421_09200 [Elusimicrobiales bacterium]
MAEQFSREQPYWDREGQQQENVQRGPVPPPPPPPLSPPSRCVQASQEEAGFTPQNTEISLPSQEAAPPGVTVRMAATVREKMVAPVRDFKVTPRVAALLILFILAMNYWNRTLIRRMGDRQRAAARAARDRVFQRKYGLDRGAPGLVKEDLASGIKFKLFGKPQFQDQVMKSLVLISHYDNSLFQQLRQYVFAIRGADRTDFAIENGVPTILLTDNTAFRSPAWCAGAIARQFFHAQRHFEREKLRHELATPSVPGQKYLDGIAANPILNDFRDAKSIERMEREADAFQLLVMRAVGASTGELLLIQDRKPSDYSLVNDGK